MHRAQLRCKPSTSRFSQTDAEPKSQPAMWPTLAGEQLRSPRAITVYPAQSPSPRFRACAHYRLASRPRAERQGHWPLPPPCLRPAHRPHWPLAVQSPSEPPPPSLRPLPDDLPHSELARADYSSPLPCAQHSHSTPSSPFPPRAESIRHHRFSPESSSPT